MEWTAETVEGLAPDAASRHRRAQARAAGAVVGARVTTSARSGACARAAARSPTRRRSTSPGPAYKCSCPSRKFPCKHALALLLLLAGGDVAAGRAPAWVAEWLASRRAGRAGGRTRAPGEPPRDPEAAARRAAEREARVAGGRRGSAALAARRACAAGSARGRLRTWEEWDAFAARMVDAQAPGAASRLRSLGQRRRRAPGRLARAAAEPAGAAAPAVRGVHPRGRPAARRRPRAARLERAARGGARRARACSDRWTVLARVVIEQERLRVQRTWLLGRARRTASRCCSTSRRRARRSNRGRRAGQRRLDASLAFYPERARRCGRWWPTRARCRSRAGIVRRRRRRGRAARRVAAAVAANPWLDEWPVALRVRRARRPRDGDVDGRRRRRRARRSAAPSAPAGACSRSPAGARCRVRDAGTASAHAAGGGRRVADGRPVSGGDGVQRAWRRRPARAGARGAAGRSARELGRARRRGADRHRSPAGGAERAARSARGLAEALAGRGPEERLLASAAAWTVARRAGARSRASRWRSRRPTSTSGRCARPRPAIGCGCCSKTTRTS